MPSESEVNDMIMRKIMITDDYTDNSANDNDKYNDDDKIMISFLCAHMD